MNAREQPALAPLGLFGPRQRRAAPSCLAPLWGRSPRSGGLGVVRFRGEAAAHHGALAFELLQRSVHVGDGQAQRRGECARRHRASGLQAVAHDLDERGFAAPVLARVFSGRVDRRHVFGARAEHGVELGQPLGGDVHGAAVAGHEPRRAPRRLQLGDERCPCRLSVDLGLGEKGETEQRGVQLVGVARVGPHLTLHARDRGGVEPAEVARRLRVDPAARHHGLRAALLERRVVEVGIGPCGQDLERQRRRLGQVARHHLHRAAFEAAQQRFEAVDVHRLVQAVVDRLLHQRVLGDLAVADDVLAAGDLVGEHGGDQVLGRHALQLRRHLAPAAHARQRERDGRVPAPARAEHRRGQQRLHEQRPHRRGRQVARGLVERERVRRRQRQHDRVFRRRGLQLEVELAAEALAQRQPPGAVDAAAQRRVDHELHAARLVEEALEDNGRECGQRAERGLGGGVVVDDLLGGGRRQRQRLGEPRERGVAAAGVEPLRDRKSVV